MASCYLCHNPTTVDDHSIDLCQECIDTYPYLTHGLIAETEPYWRDDVVPILGDGIGWYSILGFNERIDNSGASEAPTETTSPQELVTSIKSVISSFGVERTLTYLRLHSVLGEHLVDLEYTSRDEAGLTAQLSRFGIGLTMSVTPMSTPDFSHPSEMPTVTQFPSTYRDFIRLLRKIIEVFGSDEFLRTETEIKPDQEELNRIQVARAVQNRELIVSRLAFHRQYLQAMERQYTPFQIELFRLFGIDIIDSLQWSKRIVSKLESILPTMLQRAIEYRNSCLRVLGGYYLAKEVEGWVDGPMEYTSTNEYHRLHEREMVNFNDVLSEIRTSYWLDEVSLRELAGVESVGLFRNFLRCIRSKAGTQSFSSPYDHNPLDETPLVKVGRYTFLPPLPRLCYALSQRFYYLLIDKQEELGVDFGNTWGEVIEIWALNRLHKIFPHTQVAHSVKYTTPDDQGEIDILIKFGNRVLVCEVKSKRLSLESRTGSLERISSDTLDSSSGIGEALDQVTQAISALRNDEHEVDFEGNIPFSVNSSEVEKYEPVIITATHYDQLATRELPKILEEVPDSKLPYVCSVYDLDAFAVVLTAAEFVDYIDARRNEYAERQAFASGDELDFIDAYRAGVLRESTLPIPSRDEANSKGIEIIRRITPIDTGVHREVAEKYGRVTTFDPTAF